MSPPEGEPLDGIWALDADGRTAFANPAMAALLGCTPDELGQGTLWDFVAAGEAPAARDHLARRTLGVGEVRDVDLMRRGGERMRCRLATFPAGQAERGARPVALIIARDLAVERQLVDEVEASDAMLGAALSAARMYAWELDPVSGAGIWSQSAREILGLEPGAPLDNAVLRQMVHPDDRAAFFERWQTWTQAADLASAEYEFRIVRTDGQVRRLRSAYQALRYGDRVKVYGATQDVTEQRRLEEELLRARKLEGIGRLAAGVAHDFNNLITAILTSVSFLEKGSDNAAEDLEVIRAAASRAAHLVQQLQRFSGKQRIDHNELDLTDLVVDLESMLHRLCGENAHLELELEPELWPIRGDDGALGEVLVQLVANAAMALERPGKITIATANRRLGPGEAAAPGDYVELSVSDNGVGLDEATRQHLFEPLFTGEQLRLGLASCHGIVERHRGHIEVDSSAGRGTTIMVRLPRKERDAVPLAPTTGTRETILLVEDEELLRRAIVRGLAALGYDLLVAADAEEALEVAAAHDGPIHVVVSDVVLPGLGGVALTEKLRAARPDLRIVLVSGHLSDVVVRQGGSEVDYLPKPYTVDALVGRIRAVLS